MHLVLSAMLAISGVLVLILIIALSNPFRGDFRVRHCRSIECCPRFSYPQATLE
jgi:hypothetical protein